MSGILLIIVSKNRVCFLKFLILFMLLRQFPEWHILEAISNCVRHGGATELYVKISSELHEWMFEITNNGRKPDREIVEGGGLSAIRKNVGNYNGSVRICSFPEYSLTIKIPKKEEGV